MNHLPNRLIEQIKFIKCIYSTKDVQLIKHIMDLFDRSDQIDQTDQIDGKKCQYYTNTYCTSENNLQISLPLNFLSYSNVRLTYREYFIPCRIIPGLEYIWCGLLVLTRRPRSNSKTRKVSRILATFSIQFILKNLNFPILFTKNQNLPGVCF